MAWMLLYTDIRTEMSWNTGFGIKVRFLFMKYTGVVICFIRCPAWQVEFSAASTPKLKIFPIYLYTPFPDNQHFGATLFLRHHPNFSLQPHTYTFYHEHPLRIQLVLMTKNIYNKCIHLSYNFLVEKIGVELGYIETRQEPYGRDDPDGDESEEEDDKDET